MDTQMDSTAENPDYASSGYDDAYGEGFADGRKSMAASLVRKMAERLDDGQIAELTGLATSEVAALRNPAQEDYAQDNAQELDAQTATADADAPQLTFLRESPLRGTALVEPRFVKIVRAVNGFTQARLAELLGVHPDTVSTWETAGAPVRMKTATYERLHEMLPESAMPHDNAHDNIDEA